MSAEERRTNLTQRESWDLAKFVVRQNRIGLIDEFNKIVGPPSPAVTVVQADFLEGRMDQDEMIAFIKVCNGIVTAAAASDRA